MSETYVVTGGRQWTIPAWVHVPTDRPVGNTGTCRSCGAPILWVETRAGKRAPLDEGGTSHFATCPQAERWRRP